MKSHIFFIGCFLFPIFLFSQKGKTEYLVAAGLKVSFEYDSANPGIPDGNYQMLLDDKVIFEGTFKKGRRHGYWNAYYNSGEKRISGTYANNNKHHKWTYYRRDGSAICEVLFFRGFRAGEWKSFYASGEPWGIIKHNQVGKPEEAVVYTEQGKLKFHEYRVYSDSSQTGKSEFYFENGNLFATAEFKNNRIHGEYIEYYPNKIVNMRIFYDEGRLMEVRELRTDKGQPRKTGSLLNGNGTLYSYYSDGLLYASMNFKNGSPQDTSTFFYRNGIIEQVNVYEQIDGKRELIHASSFNESGKKVKVYDYDPETKRYIKVYGKNVNYGERIVQKGRREDGVAIDTVTALVGKDVVTLFETRVNNLRHGKAKYFNGISGRLEYEKEYEYGSHVGTDLQYNMSRKVIDQVDWVCYPGEIKADSGWSTLEKEGFISSAVQGVEDLEPLAERALPFKFMTQQIPGATVPEFNMEIHRSFEQVYTVDKQLGTIVYPNGLRWFLDLNLKYIDATRLENAGMFFYVDVEFDEMGLITGISVPFKDEVGVGQGIEDLLNVQPLFNPSFINGFPTKSAVRYAVSF